MAYNYMEEMKKDIKAYIEDNDFNYSSDDFDKDDFEDELYDDLFSDDSVTGNASGSYTFNRQEAKEYVSDNMDLMVEAYEEFDSIERLVEDLRDQDFERIDVTIRCYLLSSAIQEVLSDSDFVMPVDRFIGDDEDEE